MKAIVVYYSMDGNSKHVAEEIAAYTGADICRLEPVKDYPKGNVTKYIWGGKSAVFGEKPKLVPYDFSSEEYDIIIIGTPIWAGNCAPPINTFISENKLPQKKIALYACSSGGGSEKCFERLSKELLNTKLTGTLELIDPLTKKNEDNSRKIKEFCNKIMK